MNSLHNLRSYMSTLTPFGTERKFTLNANDSLDNNISKVLNYLNVEPGICYHSYEDLLFALKSWEVDFYSYCNLDFIMENNYPYVRPYKECCLPLLKSCGIPHTYYVRIHKSPFGFVIYKYLAKQYYVESIFGLNPADDIAYVSRMITHLNNTYYDNLDDVAARCLYLKKGV